MAWIRIGSTALDSTGTTITVDGFAEKPFIFVTLWTLSDGGQTVNISVNGVKTGTDYALRENTDGGSESLKTSQPYIEAMQQTASESGWNTFFIMNIADMEKLFIFESERNNTAGTGTAPNRREMVAKYAGTSASITRIDADTTSGSYDTGSEMVVYGSD